MENINGEIVAESIVKQYGDFTAVDNVSFKVETGEVYGFLGPNGAGKSTTVKILTTLALASSGTGTVGGFDITTEADKVRQVCGVALQEIGLDPLMKSMEMLTIQGQIFGQTRREAVRRAQELLELVKLSEFTDRRVGKYSGGMRRRLDLAVALMHRPRILFLDEPTTGLDPASRRDVWQEVRRLNRESGMTIFLTTQYLEEADELADRIAIIDQARIVAQDTPENLKAALGGEAVNITFPDEERLLKAEPMLEDMVDSMQRDRLTLRLYMEKAAAAVPALVNRLRDADIDIVSLTLTQPSLDDVFLSVTGERFDVGADAVTA